MKKTLAIISALVALIACTKVAPIAEETPGQNENEEIKVNFTITCAGLTDDDTKAAKAKTSFADNDVVFVFFKNLGGEVAESNLVKYLQMKYNASKDEWTPTLMGGLTADDIRNAANKYLTAVYMPYYGTSYIPYFHSDGTIFFNPSYIGYCGVFYKAQGIPYTYDSALTTETDINLQAAVGTHTSWTGSKLIHFDVAGLNSIHTYYMTQDYVNPIMFTINADCITVNTEMRNNVHSGNDILGYYDANLGIWSFSGVLSKSAVDNSKEYRFLIHDKTDGSVYSYNAGNHTITVNKKVSLGNISKWTHYPNTTKYFSVGPTQLATFASGNLQATYTDGTWTWGFAPNQYTALYYSDPTSTNKNLQYNTTGEHIGEYNGGNGTIDLFSWVGASSDLTGVQMYGIHSSTTNDAYGDTAGESLKADWGTTIDGKGTWRTPSKDELSWIISRRKTYGNRHMSTVNGVSYASYAKGSVNGINGLIIFPDNYTHPGGVTHPENVNGDTNNFAENSYSVDDWKDMENNGAVFLPATYYRKDDGSGPVWGGNSACVLYWASTGKDAKTAWRTNTTSNALNIPDNTDRKRGMAVRLIHYLN